jgi:hypothetical protein
MYVSDVFLLLASVCFTVLLVFIITKLQKFSLLYTVEQSKKLLVLARVVVAGVAGWLVLTTPFVTSSLYLATGFSASFYTDMGPLARVLFTPFLQGLTANALLLGLLQAATVGVLFLVAIGYRLRTTLPITIGLYFLVLGTMLKASLGGHLGLQSFFLLLTLWGIYEIICYHQRYKKDMVSVTYMQAIYVLFVAIAIPYTFAVVNKLKILGLGWFAPENIRSYLHINEYLGYEYWQWPLSLWSTTWPNELFYIAGAGVVLVQLLYPLILVSSRARLVLPILIILKHLAIYSFMGFLFYDLILIQLVVVYGHYLGQVAVPAVSKKRLQPVFVCMLVVLIFIPTYLTVIDKTWFPFTNWGVYYQPSSRMATDLFPYTSLDLMYANGTQEQVSIPEFQRRTGIYRYPRSRCYWRPGVLSNFADCQLYFQRVVRVFNHTKQPDDHIIEVQLRFHEWTVSELQTQKPNMFIGDTVLIYQK